MKMWKNSILFPFGNKILKTRGARVDSFFDSMPPKKQNLGRRTSNGKGELTFLVSDYPLLTQLAWKQMRVARQREDEANEEHLEAHKNPKATQQVQSFCQGLFSVLLFDSILFCFCLFIFVCKLVIDWFA